MRVPAVPRQEKSLRPRDWSAADLSGAALRTYFRIAETWGLSATESRRLLGDPPRSTYFLWKRTGEAQLSRDTLERVSYVLGIYKALQILPGARAVSWHHLEVERETEGRPYLTLSGLARDLIERHGPLHIELSLSHSDATAGAVAILVRGGPATPRAG